MNVERICDIFKQYSYSLEIIKYSDLDLNRSYQDYFVLYQTAEDIGVFYKDYIEDIAYYLELQGAILLPRYTYLLAHHNKNFMELLRSRFKDSRYKTIKSKLYGVASDAIAEIERFPVVLKSAEGSGSQFVFLAKNKIDFNQKVNKLSGVFLVNDFHSLKEFIIYRTSLALLNKVQTIYRRYPFYRKKFIVQTYIDGLQGDYKVLYFCGKYYTMYRKNRENDFRASGSGMLYPLHENEMPEGLLGVLDFARGFTFEVDFPIIGMDVGFDGKNYHLFEFQCMHMGTSAIQGSDCWHEYRNGKWIKLSGKSNLEEEFCRSIHEYIQALKNQ